MDVLNLTKLFETQKILDDRIVKGKGLEGQDLLDKKILALQVELGELANEKRSWKFWSEDRQPRTKAVKAPTMSEEDKEYYNPLLEEYVDCLHFILSIGLEYFPETVKYLYFERTKNNTIVEQLIFISTKVGTLLTYQSYNNYIHIVNNFLGLGEMLGFSWEQIEQAYFEKNKINHARQSEGY